MPFDLQTRLLRVLADGQFYRVGGHNPMKSNVRVIAATHQDLEERVKAGAFREDLFHRLNVIRLRLPPLRERTEDIAAAGALLPAEERARARRRGQAPHRRGDRAPGRASTIPGNVRQLENICHWLTVMAPAQLVDAKDLPPELQPQRSARAAAVDARRRGADGAARRRPRRGRRAGGAAADVGRVGGCRAVAAGTGAPVPRAGWAASSSARASCCDAGQPMVWETLTREFEAQLIRTALELTRGRRIEAAQKLGIGRNTITRKIQELGLDDK